MGAPALGAQASPPALSTKMRAQPATLILAGFAGDGSGLAPVYFINTQAGTPALPGLLFHVGFPMSG